MAFADTFKALSDPARREILELLRETRLSAGDIASKFDMTGATISYHLSVLKKWNNTSKVMASTMNAQR